MFASLYKAYYVLYHINLSALLFVLQAAPKKPDTGPGPGSYEMQSYEGIQAHQEKKMGRTLANFKQNEYTDRFGRYFVYKECNADRRIGLHGRKTGQEVALC